MCEKAGRIKIYFTVGTVHKCPYGGEDKGIFRWLYLFLLYSLLRMWRIICARWRRKKESSVSQITEEVGSIFRLYELINFYLRNVWSVKEILKVFTFPGRKFPHIFVNVPMVHKRKVTLVLFEEGNGSYFLRYPYVLYGERSEDTVLLLRIKERTHPFDEYLIRRCRLLV